MGGSFNYAFILSKSIDSMILFTSKAFVKLKTGERWLKINGQQYGLTISCVPEHGDAGTVYNVTGSLLIARQHLTDDVELYCSQLAKFRGCVSYEMFGGIKYIAGSKDTPLKFTYEVLTPSKPSGFNGAKLSFSGKQTTPLLVLEDL